MSTDERAVYRSFKTRLTRRWNRKDYHGVIRLWAEFQQHYDNNNAPWPDDWHRWQRYADDAAIQAYARVKAGRMARS